MRFGKRRFIMAAAVVVAAVTLVWFVAREASEFLQIDTCLDRGGRWDYDREECSGARHVL